jgi:hypothetical protein
MAIEIPPADIRDYLKAYKLGCAFVIEARGAGIQLGAGRELPRGVRIVQAWWTDSPTSARDVIAVALQSDLRAARRVGPFLAVAPAAGCAAVEAAASRLAIRLGPHDATVSKAKDCVARLDEALQRARSSGELKHFNSEFRRRRERAALSNAVFMSYPQALSKYRTAVAAAIAGELAPIEIVAKVFD